MKKLIFIFILFLISSCGLLNKIPKEEVHVVIRDSVAVSYRDSVVLVPKEVLMEVAPVDSSHLETTYAISDAWVDSLALLHHKLVQKPVKEQFKEKIVYKERRDTTYIEKPIPYEVEKIKEVVPKWCWWLLVIVAAEVVVFAVKIYLKIKSGGIQLPKIH